jgi:hypothetical protein
VPPSTRGQYERYCNCVRLGNGTKCRELTPVVEIPRADIHGPHSFPCVVIWGATRVSREVGSGLSGRHDLQETRSQAYHPQAELHVFEPELITSPGICKITSGVHLYSGYFSTGCECLSESIIFVKSHVGLTCFISAHKLLVISSRTNRLRSRYLRMLFVMLSITRHWFEVTDEPGGFAEGREYRTELVLRRTETF